MTLHLPCTLAKNFPKTLLRGFLFAFFLLFAGFFGVAQAPAASRASGGSHDHLIEPLTDNELRMVEQYRKTADRYISINDANEATRYLNKIGYLYWEKGHAPDAIRSFSQSLKLTEQVGNLNGMALLHNNIGMIHSDNENYETAIESFRKTLEIRKKTKQKVGIVSSLINIANMYGNTKNYTASVATLEEALPIAQELNDERMMASCYGALAQNHQKAGNAEKSIYYFKYYVAFEQRLQDAELHRKEEEARAKMSKMAMHTQDIENEKLLKERELMSKTDSLHNIDAALHKLEVRAAKEAQTQQMQIDLLNQAEKIKELSLKDKDSQLKNEAYFRYMMFAVLAMIVAFAIFFYRSYKQKQKDHAKLEEQNAAIMRQSEELAAQKDNIEMQRGQLLGAFEEITTINTKITGSINYAKRIQNAMLPDAEDLTAMFPKSFILFKPRDIVSGDYYWFTEIKTDLSTKHLLTAADCTGHGVPGALLTMIALNMLNDIVTVRHIIEADLILNELHKGIRKALKQDETENRDGMDMAMCVIDKKANTMEFAGAKNPVVYIQNNELHYLKGDMHPIGGLQKETQRIFQKQMIDIAQPTYVYIFSDGYADQFGGAEDKKFTIKKFKELLLTIHKKDSKMQRQILDQTIENWKSKSSSQLDDILVMGFSVN
jgi:serine phosphatase RsbU (regulator of sigma subunit)